MSMTGVEPSRRAILVCPACGAALTTPLRAVPDARLFVAPPAIRRQGIQSSQGFWRRAPPGELSQGVPTDSFPVSIHPHDLLFRQVEASGWGCCGVYSADGRANLHCRCGGPVGVLVDECVFDVEVRLGASWRLGADDDHADGSDDDDDQADARVRAALDRWSRVRFAEPPICVDTYWDWEPSEVPTVHAVEHLELALMPSDDGVGLHATVDGRAFPLPLAPIDLLRAIALRRLPIGHDGLALRYDLMASLRDTQVVSFWGLVRRGDVIELIESPASTSYPTGVPLRELDRMPLADARALGKLVARESEPRGWRFSEADLRRAWSAAIDKCDPEQLGAPPAAS
jgi:hypothetical protein